MSVRELAVLAILVACSPRAPRTTVPTAPAAAVTLAATVSAPPVAPLPEVKASPAATVEPDLPLPPPPGLDAFAKLPPGAAIYSALRLSDLPSSIVQLVLQRWLPFELTRRFRRETTPTALLATLGIDARRAIVVAVLPPSEKSARALLDSVAIGAADEIQEKLLREHAGDAVRLRLLVPLLKGADVAAAAASISESITHVPAADACPGAASCAAFGADPPLRLARNSSLIVTAYADGPDLQLDLAIPLFAPATEPGALAALVAFRSLRGGSGARCSRLDPGASVAVCVDADAAGELSTSMGYAHAFESLPTGLLVREPRRTAATAGRAESQHSLTLARPERRLATDGTLMLHVRGDAWSVLGTWALTAASRSGVEKAFKTWRCATGAAAVTELLPVLRAAFGAPGKGFSDHAQTLQALKDVGLGTYPIALAGSWPNLLDVAAASLPGDLVPNASQQLCFHTDAGRLVLEIKDIP